jgi:hypothetical protein
MFANKMSTITNRKAIAICIGAAILTMSAAHAAPSAKRVGYAEKIYNEYAESADDKIGFEVTVASHGKLKALAGKAFSSIIDTPRRKLTAEDNGFVTTNHAFSNVGANSAEFADLTKNVSDFEAIGYPVAEGTYRILDVVTTVGRDISSHKAIEFCWKSQFHCVLLDPSIEFVDSIANNRMMFMAQGVGPTVTTEAVNAVAKLATVQGITGTCGLASNHGIKQRTVTYNARTVTYKNVFKNTLVTKDLGGQQSGVSCDTSCKPKPYGYANVSSADGRLGWRTACADNSALGITGTTAKYIGKTMCTHKYAVAASASITVEGVGSGVDLNVDAGGGVDANGGAVYESCGYF